MIKVQSQDDVKRARIVSMTPCNCNTQFSEGSTIVTGLMKWRREKDQTVPMVLPEQQYKSHAWKTDMEHWPLPEYLKYGFRSKLHPMSCAPGGAMHCSEGIKLNWEMKRSENHSIIYSHDIPTVRTCQ